MNASFWVNRKVMITGHTGFKGSWLSLWLQQLGAIVTGYSLHPSTKPNMFERTQVAEGMKSVIGDVRDQSFLAKIMQQAEPEIVFHLAAQPLVRHSYAAPVETYSTNVMGTVYLMEAVRQTQSVRAVVNVTTDKCYENKEWAWGYREIDPMGGFDPYSSSKGCSELVTAAYRNSFFSSKIEGERQVALATARAGNVIGGGDWADDRLIPDILRAIEMKQSIKIRNPKAVRPWQHVLEPLSGYLILAENLYSKGSIFAEAFNFGPSEDDVKTVEWIVEQVIKNWGREASWHIDDRNHLHEAKYLKLDCSKARDLLSWRPRWSLNQALRSIVDWQIAHTEQRDSHDMRALSVHQIEEFMKHSNG